MKRIILVWLLGLSAWSAVSMAAQEQRAEVLLETTEGNIRIALFNETPQHRDNFLKLVGEHFYDSLLFHRVIRNFMIQAGDPQSRHAEPGASLGSGDVGYQIDAEIRFPQLYHRRGMVAAARESDRTNRKRRSSGCQFYIVWGQRFSTPGIEQMQEHLDEQTKGQVKLTDEQKEVYRKIGGTPHLDGQYTVFGEVTEGLDVVEKIQQVITDDYDRPVDDVRILRATVCR